MTDKPERSPNPADEAYEDFKRMLRKLATKPHDLPLRAGLPPAGKT
jgi:hypothetical protein